MRAPRVFRRIGHDRVDLLVRDVAKHHLNGRHAHDHGYHQRPRTVPESRLRSPDLPRADGNRLPSGDARGRRALLHLGAQ
jgi:hypothetical protein